MKVILVDSRYIGCAITQGRKMARINRAEAAKMLGISKNELSKYERGNTVIPNNVLERLMVMGIMALQSRNFLRHTPKQK